MDKCLLITGASRGIGFETAALFVKNNWQVINFSRSPCNIDGVINIEVDFGNLSLTQQQNDQVTAILKQCKQISIVHNAATLKSDNVKTLNAKRFNEVMDINLSAAVELNHLFIPFMPKGSSIIYVGSTLSEIAVPNRASYVISKHALVGLMRATCQDLAAEKIHTCCICPGFVNTQMLAENVDINSAFNEFIEKKVVLGRLIEPHEIADLIFFCATHPVINGAVLHASLGQTMS